MRRLILLVALGSLLGVRPAVAQPASPDPFSKPLTRKPPQITVRKPDQPAGVVIDKSISNNPWPELAAKLRAKGCDLIEAHPGQVEMGRVLVRLGMTDTPTKLYRVKADDQGVILVGVCKSPEVARQMINERLPTKMEYGIWRNVLIVRLFPNDHWGLLSDAMEAAGVERGTTTDLQRAQALNDITMNFTRRNQLMTLRAQIELFRIRNEGALPDLEHHQWQDLIAQNYVKAPPRNPCSPPEVSTKIIVSKSGKDLDPKTAGWGFDPEKGELYAAGSPD